MYKKQTRKRSIKLFNVITPMISFTHKYTIKKKEKKLTNCDFIYTR